MPFAKKWLDHLLSYDVISRSHSNRFSPILRQNAFKIYAYSYWKWQVLVKNHLGNIQETSYDVGASTFPLVRQRVKPVKPSFFPRISGFFYTDISIHPSIHPSIRLPNHPPIHLCINRLPISSWVSILMLINRTAPFHAFADATIDFV